MRSILVFIILTITASTQGADLQKIRNQYVLASSDESIHTRLTETLRAVNEESPVLFGYKAANYMMSAQFTYNPYSKYRYFKDGKTMIEKIIGTNPNNIELRYLRLSIQLNLPDVLDYSANIEGDTQFLLQKYSSLTDTNLKARIRDLLIHFELCKASDLT